MKYQPARIPIDEALNRGRAFHQLMEGRRSVRMFSDEQVPRQCIEIAVATANTAPSGAHQQPWTFCATKDREIKHKIRIAAEKEEKENVILQTNENNTYNKLEKEINQEKVIELKIDTLVEIIEPYLIKNNISNICYVSRKGIKQLKTKFNIIKINQFLIHPK